MFLFQYIQYEHATIVFIQFIFDKQICNIVSYISMFTRTRELFVACLSIHPVMLFQLSCNLISYGWPGPLEQNTIMH